MRTCKRTYKIDRWLEAFGVEFYVRGTVYDHSADGKEDTEAEIIYVGFGPSNNTPYIYQLIKSYPDICGMPACASWEWHITHAAIDYAMDQRDGWEPVNEHDAQFDMDNVG